MKNLGFDPNFFIRIVRDRELNAKLLPATANKAEPLPGPVFGGRNITECSRRKTFHENVAVYTVCAN